MRIAKPSQLPSKPCRSVAFHCPRRTKRAVIQNAFLSSGSVHSSFTIRAQSVHNSEKVEKDKKPPT